MSTLSSLLGVGLVGGGALLACSSSSGGFLRERQPGGDRRGQCSLREDRGLHALPDPGRLRHGLDVRVARVSDLALGPRGQWHGLDANRARGLRPGDPERLVRRRASGTTSRPRASRWGCWPPAPLAVTTHSARAATATLAPAASAGRARRGSAARGRPVTETATARSERSVWILTSRPPRRCKAPA